MNHSLTFLGGAGTVTGSKYLLEIPRRRGRPVRILIDAGMFQGSRSWREKNWEDLDAKLLGEIDACLITHAHVDHTGILPRLVRNGLGCPVYCSKPTADLMKLVLLDSAALQEEDAAFRAKQGTSRHNPPLPLYTKEDAENALHLLKPVSFGRRIKIHDEAEAEWHRTGHILGAASISLYAENFSMNFSGDLGRYDAPILRDPEPVDFGDYLLIESTYGDRVHENGEGAEKLGRIVRETADRGGAVVIPSFAIGRTQTLLFYLRELKEQRKIPDLPIIIDSPMASDTTELYAKYPSDYDEESLQIIKAGRRPFSTSKQRFVQSRGESIALNSIHEPMVLISASGMLTGGRILHHLKHRLPVANNTLLFVGFQPPGSRGAWLKGRPATCKIFNQDIPVRARVEEIGSFSAHADKNEMLRWCRESSGRPKRVVVVHGEPEAAKKFAQTLSDELNWTVGAAGYKEELTL